MSTHFADDPDPVTSSGSPEAFYREGTHGQSQDSSAGKSHPLPEAGYEEVAQSSELFWEKLEAFHRSFGTNFAAPTVGGKTLDLYCLFVEVTSRGGLEKVIRDRRWKEVTVVFDFPATEIASSSFFLRKHYLSLLYQFEQAYYFHKVAPSISNADRSCGNSTYGSGTLDVLEEELPDLQLGSSVTGTIDAKFENGYVVSVKIGSQELKGVLYHSPHTLGTSGISSTSTKPRHKKRRRSQMARRDPSRPKPNRSGYTFFFAEHYAKLKPLYYGQEKAISTRIGLLWSKLTEAEKQVYQEKGRRDKERYKMQMLEYKSNLDLR